MTRDAQTYVLFSALFAPHMGGVESYTAGLAGELARRGHKVAVVTSRLAPEHPAHEVREDGVEVFRLPCTPPLGGRLPLPRRNAEHARMLDEVAALNPTRVVVNTRFYGHSADGARFAAKLGVPAIVVEHGSAHLSLGNAALDGVVEAYEHRVTKRIAAFGMPFYGVSEACLNWLGHFGIEGAGVVPNSVDMAAYAQAASERDFRAELGLAEGELLVASVGRLVPEKGVGALLDAARILEGEGFAFAFAGDGPLLEAVEAEARKSGGSAAADSGAGERHGGEPRCNGAGAGDARSKVFALGRLAPADTAALLRAADVYCLPSRSEGFATTLLEACAMGTFPVVTEVGGVKELGIGRIGGIVLDEASGPCVAEALRRVKADREKCAAEGLALREAASAENSWSASADALEGAFAPIEKQSRPASAAEGAVAEKAVAASAADEAPFEGDERLDQLHRVLLMMLKDFAALCERENLTWLAMYGTAIGALRHGGFIPWDDDLDIVMPRADLERLTQLVNGPAQAGGGKYAVINAQTHPGYPLATYRLVLVGTEFRDSNLATMDFPSGIFLDLFPLDVLAPDERARKRQIWRSWLYNKLAIAKLTRNPYIGGTGLARAVLKAGTSAARGLLNAPGIRRWNPNAAALRWLLRYEGREDESECLGYPCDTNRFWDIYEKSELFPARWVPFEDTQVPLPREAEKLLSALYGDWLTPPPSSARKVHYPDVLDFGEYGDL